MVFSHSRADSEESMLSVTEPAILQLPASFETQLARMDISPKNNLALMVTYGWTLSTGAVVCDINSAIIFIAKEDFCSNLTFVYYFDNYFCVIGSITTI